MDRPVALLKSSAPPTLADVSAMVQLGTNPETPGAVRELALAVVKRLPPENHAWAAATQAAAAELGDESEGGAVVFAVQLLTAAPPALLHAHACQQGVVALGRCLQHESAAVRRVTARELGAVALRVWLATEADEHRARPFESLSEMQRARQDAEDAVAEIGKMLLRAACADADSGVSAAAFASLLELLAEPDTGRAADTERAAGARFVAAHRRRHGIELPATTPRAAILPLAETRLAALFAAVRALKGAQPAAACEFVTRVLRHCDAAAPHLLVEPTVTLLRDGAARELRARDAIVGWVESQLLALLHARDRAVVAAAARSVAMLLPLPRLAARAPAWALEVVTAAGALMQAEPCSVGAEALAAAACALLPGALALEAPALVPLVASAPDPEPRMRATGQLLTHFVDRLLDGSVPAAAALRLVRAPWVARHLSAAGTRHVVGEEFAMLLSRVLLAKSPVEGSEPSPRALRDRYAREWRWARMAVAFAASAADVVAQQHGPRPNAPGAFLALLQELCRCFLPASGVRAVAYDDTTEDDGWVWARRRLLRVLGDLARWGVRTAPALPLRAQLMWLLAAHWLPAARELSDARQLLDDVRADLRRLDATPPPAAGYEVANLRAEAAAGAAGTAADPALRDALLRCLQQLAVAHPRLTPDVLAALEAHAAHLSSPPDREAVAMVERRVRALCAEHVPAPPPPPAAAAAPVVAEGGDLLSGAPPPPLAVAEAAPQAPPSVRKIFCGDAPLSVEPATLPVGFSQMDAYHAQVAAALAAVSLPAPAPAPAPEKTDGLVPLPGEPKHPLTGSSDPLCVQAGHSSDAASRTVNVHLSLTNVTNFPVSDVRVELRVREPLRLPRGAAAASWALAGPVEPRATVEWQMQLAVGAFADLCLDGGALTFADELDDDPQDQDMDAPADDEDALFAESRPALSLALDPLVIPFKTLLRAPPRHLLAMDKLQPMWAAMPANVCVEAVATRGGGGWPDAAAAEAELCAAVAAFGGFARVPAPMHLVFLAQTWFDVPVAFVLTVVSCGAEWRAQMELRAGDEPTAATLRRGTAAWFSDLTGGLLSARPSGPDSLLSSVAPSASSSSPDDQEAAVSQWRALQAERVARVAAGGRGGRSGSVVGLL